MELKIKAKGLYGEKEKTIVIDIRKSTLSYDLISDTKLYPILVNAAKNAKERILINSYLFEASTTGNMAELSNAYADAVKRGVKLQIVFNNDANSVTNPTSGRPWLLSTISFLESIGLKNKAVYSNVENGYRIITGLHAKNILIDNSFIVIGSHNYNANGLFRNLEDSTVIYNPTQEMIDALVRRHNAFWNEGKYTAVDTVSYPRIVNGSNYFNTLINAINNAKQRVYIATYTYSKFPRVDTFMNACINAKKRNVDVKFVLDTSTSRALSDILTANNIPFKRIKSPYGNIQHSKLKIIDNLVSVDSMNLDFLDGTGQLAVLFTDDMIYKAIDRFNYLWSLS